MILLLALVGVSVLVQQVCRGGAQSCSWMSITPNGSSGGGGRWGICLQSVFSPCALIGQLCVIAGVCGLQEKWVWI